VPTSLPVLYEDNHLLAVNKPAGLPTMGAIRGRATAVDAAKAYLKQKYQKPGNVYLGVMSRLDAPVSGVLLLARTSKAAARLTEQFKGGTVEKTYWALVEGDLSSAAGEWRDAVLKDEAAERMRVVAAGRAGAKQAVLRYRRLAEAGDGVVLVEIELLTGRKHQIRVQFASRGHPIFGDRKYGSSVPFPIGIALHSRRLAVEHPVKNERIELEAPLPAHWRRWINDDNVGREVLE
jgi:23S rRNA pseudouridine1911/1915/1917 synthase